ncbi:hypothetical protein BC567DRAFT_220191 [Phyllosticta citribraziliensis]
MQGSTKQQKTVTRSGAKEEAKTRSARERKIQGCRIEPSLPMPTHPDCRATNAPTPPVPITPRLLLHLAFFRCPRQTNHRFISAPRTYSPRPRSRAQ